MTKRRSQTFPGLEGDPDEVITFRFTGSGILTLPPDIVAVTLAAAQLTVGDPAADHVFIDNQGAKIQDGTTVRGHWQTDGDIFIGSDLSDPSTTYFSIFATNQTYNSESVTAGDMLIGDNSASKANIFWDESEGQMLFRGGTTTAVLIDTDGTLTAGGGNVIIDGDGISIANKLGLTQDPDNSYKFHNATGFVTAGLYGVDYTAPPGTTTNQLFLTINAESGHAATMVLNCLAGSSSLKSTLSLIATSSALATEVILVGQGSGQGITFNTSNDGAGTHGIANFNTWLILAPRNTTTVRNALSPISGSQHYNTTTNRYEFYENNRWNYHPFPAYGEISVNNNTTATTITTINVAVQFTLFDTQSATLQDTTPSAANDEVKIDIAGDYLITCSLTIESVAGAGATFDFEIMKNNGASRVGAIHAHRDLSGGGGDVGSVSLSGLDTLAANDTIELWVTNNSNTQNIILEDAILSVIKIS